MPACPIALLLPGNGIEQAEVEARYLPEFTGPQRFSWALCLPKSHHTHTHKAVSHRKSRQPSGRRAAQSPSVQPKAACRASSGLTTQGACLRVYISFLRENILLLGGYGQGRHCKSPASKTQTERASDAKGIPTMKQCIWLAVIIGQCSIHRTQKRLHSPNLQGR